MRLEYHSLGSRRFLQRCTEVTSPPFHGFLQFPFVALDRIVRLLELQQQLRSQFEFCHLERLGDEIVDAGFNRAESILLAVEPGQHDDRQGQKLRVLADALSHLEPVQVWHSRIQEDQVDIEPQLGECLEPVASDFRLIAQ